jgi:hypothetical protein
MTEIQREREVISESIMSGWFERSERNNKFKTEHT